ncbi:MAG: tol-pal system protein YbgF [Candidatus Marinimicrobia bacterium]|nr:tol-pal system protein YbgF [Candidatus Neomarinimicrobiota bacterium]MCF7827686.1 tol-pal system protein YbgF [Candidatus Neomarinimicrobiota bacterium]MCF7881259.1 tol-pal system protein YbgF [Candidatus Neomarinimicrobiota bacterium]
MKTTRYLLKMIPVLGISLLLLQCGSGGDQSAAPEDLQRQVSEHDSQLEQYSENADSLQQKVEQLRQTINALEQSNSELKSMLAEREGQKFDLDNEQAIADKIIQMENRLSMLEDRIDFIDSTKFDMLTRFEKLEAQVGGPGSSTGTASQSGTSSADKLSKEAYRDKYQQAYNVYSQKDYNRAITLFTDLIERNPEGDLSDNAQYWIGECYYGLKNYTRAIVEFEKVFTFKESNKDDDAQLKLGLCYLNLGQRDKAREEFQRLVDFYPDSDYRSKAVEYLRQL